MRRLLVEATQSYTRGTIGHKSVALKQRQKEIHRKSLHMQIKRMNGLDEDFTK